MVAAAFMVAGATALVAGFVTAWALDKAWPPK